MRTRPLLLALLAVAGLTGPLTGQSLTAGAILVRVEDAAGAPVTEVLLTLEDAATGLSRSAMASRGGEHTFSPLPPGEYTLTTERIGFAPRRLTGIPVRPQQRLPVLVALAAAGAGALEVMEDRFSAGLSAAPGAAQLVPGWLIRGVPGASGQLPGLTRFLTAADESLAVEGMPAGLSAFAIDGVPFRAATRPAFALRSVAEAQLLTNAVDGEWSGSAGSVLSAYTRRGSRSAGGAVFGTFTVDGGLEAGVELQGALPAEDSRYSVGVSGRRRELAASAAWPDTDAAARLIAADGAGAGLGLDAYAADAVMTEDVVSAFGHVDWTLSGRHVLEGSVQLAAVPQLDAPDPLTGAATRVEGHDLLMRLALTSRLGARTHNELRLSFTSSGRSDAAEDDALPLTLVVADAIGYGGRPRPGSVEDGQVRLTNALHVAANGHALKAGIEVSAGTHSYTSPAGGAAQYLFGSVDELLAGRGAFAGTARAFNAIDWTDRTVAAFVQDRVDLGGGLELTAGVRAERQTLPGDVRRDTAWARLTGVANDSADAPGVRLSPRASLTWDVGQTGRLVLHAAGGLYHDRLDPTLLAAWQSDDGTATVRRIVGTLGWPPAAGETGWTAARLTVLGPGFEAPRTARAVAGVGYQLATGTTASLTGVIRRTRNLPRRTDLNLVPLPTAHDQHGRAVYGTLVQQGGLLAAEPGSNRRFTTYDEVAALAADGESDHWGITADIEHSAGSALSVIARYTYGRTTDDWAGAAAGGWLQVRPEGLGEDWASGTADLDIPHRAVLAAVATGPYGVRAGGAYRLQSGRPFSPGFRPGVDANGDGSAFNDPAFVDESIAGIAELVRDNACLSGSAGGFAERNSCRTPVQHALDLSLTVPLLRLAGGTAAVAVYAFDVLESERGAPDAALYLVDPAGSVVADPVARTVTLPLIANPEFGESLARRTTGRTLRVGLSFNW